MIIEICKRYRELEASSKEQGGILKEINQRWTECENELLEAMVEEGSSSLKFPGVGHFSMSNRTFISYTAANKEQCMQYLQHVGQEKLIKADIAKAAFDEFIPTHLESLKAKYEEAGFDIVDARKAALADLANAGFSEFTKRTISVRKA